MNQTAFMEARQRLLHNGLHRLAGLKDESEKEEGCKRAE